MVDTPPGQGPIDSNAVKLAIMGRISLAVDVLLICGCVYLLTNDVMKALSEMPEFVNRGGAFLVNLSATFALVHRGMALMQRFSLASSMAKWAVVLKWVALLLLPLGVATAIERAVQKGHRAQLDALVEDVSARVANAIANNAQVRASDLQTLQGPYLSSLTVRSDSGAFLLHAQVPAFDATGYSARYSSLERRWHLQPLDSATQNQLAFDINGPILECTMQDKELVKGLSCEHRQP